MRISIITLFILFSLNTYSQADTTFSVLIKSIDLVEKYTYYNCYLYDSSYTDNKMFLKYVFKEKSDLIVIEVGKEYTVNASKSSPCIFISRNDTINFCRSCRVVFADAFLGKRPSLADNENDSVIVIGQFYKIESLQK